MNQLEIFERNQSIITGEENLKEVWNLPNFPFTEFFGDYNPSFPTVDQRLMLCPQSGIFQLKREVGPSFLYHSGNYNFRTLITPKIERELDFFIDSSALRNRLNSRSRILEIGGNNSVLASRLESHFSKYVICDPIVENSSGGPIEYWAGLVEEKIDLIEEYQPTVILGRHVLEHVSSPVSLLQSLLERIRGKVIFVFEFPNFRLMQQKQRFDAIFHQHLNYFDEKSIQKLIESVGCKILTLQNNSEGSNGGSLIVSFTNDTNGDSRCLGQLEPSSGSAMDNFESSLALFQVQIELLSETLTSWKGEKVGFGAGLMLATLNYHLGGEVENLTAIYDDDASKDGTFYQNLSVEIKSSSKLVDSQETLILVTSMENQRKIGARLSEFPKSTVLGFQTR